MRLLWVLAILMLVGRGVANVNEEETCSFDSCDAEDHMDVKLGEVVIPKNANAQGKPRDASIDCEDRYSNECPYFASQGECEKNPGWMIMFCSKSCKSCHLRDHKVRCDRHRLDMDPNPIYKPGDMNAMFESIYDRYHNDYEVKIWSRDPWLITIDNFFTNQQMKTLISMVDKWERSTDTGSMNEFGESGRILSSGRTSSNAWCSRDCAANPIVQSMLKKIEDVTFIPQSHYETFQILRYDEGQYYSRHHDASMEDNALACGPRILTFFIYMSDVEEGGETSFPDIGLEVKPKKGRIVLWPSMTSDNLSRREERTTHIAKPVIKGRKIAANAWIHLYNYDIPNLWGCTGTFDELS